MTPERAGKLCDDLDKTLRGSEFNLAGVAKTIVVVIRDEAWRRRRIRTGEIVECTSFLELLTAPPLHGFGEDPQKVEALLKDDAEALRMFREATTEKRGKRARLKADSDIASNRSNKPKHGTTRAYALDRLHRDAPALYAEVVAGTLTANQAAIRAGFRRTKTPLDQLRHWWAKASADERAEFEREVNGNPSQ